jgi:hypothetical protein
MIARPSAARRPRGRSATTPPPACAPASGTTTVWSGPTVTGALADDEADRGREPVGGGAAGAEQEEGRRRAGDQQPEEQDEAGQLPPDGGSTGPGDRRWSRGVSGSAYGKQRAQRIAGRGGAPARWSRRRRGGGAWPNPPAPAPPRYAVPHRLERAHPPGPPGRIRQQHRGTAGRAIVAHMHRAAGGTTHPQSTCPVGHHEHGERRPARLVTTGASHPRRPSRRPPPAPSRPRPAQRGLSSTGPPSVLLGRRRLHHGQCA